MTPESLICTGDNEHFVLRSFAPRGKLGPSRTRGQKCLLMSKNCHHDEKPSATGLFTKGQNLAGDGQTSKMPSTTSGAGQTETNDLTGDM